MGNSPRAKRLIVLTAVTFGCAALLWHFGRDASTPAGDASDSGDALAIGGDVIALVDGQPILRDEWQSRVGDVSPQQSRRLLQSEARRLAVLAAAEKAGYAERDEVRKRVEEAIVALYLRESVAATVESLTVSDAELEAYFADNPISPPEPLRRAAIIRRQLAEGEDAGTIEASLLSAREAALASTGAIAHFGSVAAGVSDHRGSSGRGGIVGYFKSERSRYDEIPAAVHAALWALEKPGDISGVVEDDGKFYLVRFVDEHVRPGQDLESQRALIAERLLREKRRIARQELFDRIENQAGVAIAADWRAQPLETRPPEPPASPIASQPAPPIAQPIASATGSSGKPQ